MPKKQAKTTAPAEIPQVDLSYIVAALRPLAEPIDGLVLDPRNAKVHQERDLAAIGASLRRFGIRKPIVVRRETRVVIAGNGQLQAARANGWTHYPIVWVDDDDETATGYAIADNRTADLAEYDQERLRDLLAEVDWSGDSELERMVADLTADLDDLVGEALEVSAEPSAGPAAKPAKAPAVKAPADDARFEIVIACRDEQHQIELLERFEKEQLTCRALTS